MIDVMDLLFSKIHQSLVCHKRSLVYAAFIQAFIDKVTKKTYDYGPFFRTHGMHKPAIEKLLKGCTKSLRNGSTRDIEFMDIPGSSIHSNKMRDMQIRRALRTVIRMKADLYADRRMLIENNLMLKKISRSS